jgi:hypothetical protein
VVASSFLYKEIEMADGKRPGGLTALAVLNFVFGGLGAIGTLLAFGAVSLIKKGIEAAEASGGTVKYEGQGMAAAYIVILLSAVGAFLLIVSGVGYLKQSKFMGRTLGTVYALVSLGGTAVGVVTGGGIGFFTIIFSVYPVLTLIMVNTTFKDDLVN